MSAWHAHPKNPILVFALWFCLCFVSLGRLCLQGFAALPFACIRACISKRERERERERERDGARSPRDCGPFSEPIFGKGMRRSTFQWKKGIFSEKGGGNSVNQGLGKDFYRKGNSVKRFGLFAEPPDSQNWKLAVLIPFPKIISYLCLHYYCLFWGNWQETAYPHTFPMVCWAVFAPPSPSIGPYKKAMEGNGEEWADEGRRDLQEGPKPHTA